MEEVTLRICNIIFKVNKELLCEYSDYFRAMFSGNYVESEKQEINIEMVKPDIMRIILKYMQLGMILLSEYPLSTILEIAIAADFLQVTELTKQIQYVLDIQLSESNWMETMDLAQRASYTQLEKYSAAFGLYSFNVMKPEYIPTINKLVWYLCHPYLDSESEQHVFNLGLKWLLKNQRLEHASLILACIDMTRISNQNLLDIKKLLMDYHDHICDSSVLEMIECLLELTSQNLTITEFNMYEHKTMLIHKYSEKVWSELLSIVKHSRARLIKYIPVVPTRQECLPHCMYSFEEDKGFENYLEVAEKNLWGWNVAAWGLNKLVVVCGEHGRGTGIFMRDVKVYDTLRKKWTLFGVQLPPRRHAGVTTVGDLLYIVGGVGEYRVVLETAVIFDLKGRTCRKIAKLPDAIQSPAVCTHKNKVYATGHRNIYCYETNHDNDCWSNVLSTNMRINYMKSYKNYIYCMQNYFTRLYRFRPGIDLQLFYITSLSFIPVAMCTSPDYLMIFTQTENHEATVELYKGESENKKPILLPVRNNQIKVNDVAGCCSLVMTMPPLFTELPEYHEQYLTRHTI